jgi:hypothetical protein
MTDAPAGSSAELQQGMLQHPVYHTAYAIAWRLQIKFKACSADLLPICLVQISTSSPASLLHWHEAGTSRK